MTTRTEVEFRVIKARWSADRPGLLSVVDHAHADVAWLIAEVGRLRAGLAAAEEKIRRVETVRCWRNEDGKAFVFASDLQEALADQEGAVT